MNLWVPAVADLLINDLLHNFGMIAWVDRQPLRRQERVLLKCHRLVSIVTHDVFEHLGLR